MLEKIKTLLKEKIAFHRKCNHGEWTSGSFYKKGLISEIAEVGEEYKEHNIVYLEDELSDIFTAYIQMLYSLEGEGKISSVEKVFERGHEKIQERINYNITSKEDWINHWNKIKIIQKEKLEKEHEAKYGTQGK